MSSVELPDDNEKSLSSASTSPCPSPVSAQSFFFNNQYYNCKRPVFRDSPTYDGPALYFARPVTLPLFSPLLHGRVRSSWVPYKVTPSEESVFHEGLTIV
jgi:hypothetical protein